MRAAFAASLALLGTGPALLATGPAFAESPAVCEIAAEVAGDAMVMRQARVSQRRAADQLAGQISEAINGARGDTATKRHVARIIGNQATFLLQAAYSMPVERGNSNKAAAVMAMKQVAYDHCRTEW